MRTFRCFALCLSSVLLAACSALPSFFNPLPWSSGLRRDPPAPVPDPSLSYLRARLAGRTAYLVLGNREPTLGGATEVYYSAAGEVVKLHQGRIVGTAGLPLDWRDVRRTDAPDWATLIESPLALPAVPIRYTRERDEMPGYRFGIRDEVSVRAIDSPAGMTALAAPSLRWFEETSQPLDAASGQLQPSRFAVLASPGSIRVVYSEQCLAPTLCLSLETWPTASGAADGGRHSGRPE